MELKILPAVVRFVFGLAMWMTDQYLRVAGLSIDGTFRGSIIFLLNPVVIG